VFSCIDSIWLMACFCFTETVRCGKVVSFVGIFIVLLRYVSACVMMWQARCIYKNYRTEWCSGTYPSILDSSYHEYLAAIFETMKSGAFIIPTLMLLVLSCINVSLCARIRLFDHSNHRGAILAGKYVYWELWSWFWSSSLSRSWCRRPWPHMFQHGRFGERSSLVCKYARRLFYLIRTWKLSWTVDESCPWSWRP
jgi:hypothetical protein